MLLIIHSKKRAYHYYEMAIDINSNYDYCYYRKGNILERLKMYDKALEDYDKAIAINDNDERYYLSRGLLHLKFKKKDEAEKDFKKVLSLNPNNKKAKKKLRSLNGLVNFILNKC